MQYGYPPVVGGGHAIPRVEGGGWVSPVRVPRPPRPVRGLEQGLQHGPVLRLIVLDQGDGGRGDRHAGGMTPDDDGLGVLFSHAVRRANRQRRPAVGLPDGNGDSRQGVGGGVIGALGRRAAQAQGNLSFLCPSGTQLGGDGYIHGEFGIVHEERVYREGDGLGLTQGRPQVQRQTDAGAKEERDKPEAFKGKREVGHFSSPVDDNSPRIMSRHCRRAHTGYLASTYSLYPFQYRQP